jgi:hypothetical protein
MNIEESNVIVKDVIFDNLTNKNKIVKSIDEFGYFKYYIHNSLNDKSQKIFKIRSM